MVGAELRAERLFDRESGRSFIVAFDHGLSLRVPLEAGRPMKIVENVIAGEPDGVLISPGLLERSAYLFAFRGAPLPIVRADFIHMDERVKYLGDRHRVVCAPRDALALGAEAMVMYLVFGPEDGDVFADNVRAIGETAREAHQAGIPLIVESVLWGSRAADRRDPDLLAYVCRMAAELGADLIKTEYTGDPETMAGVIEGCPVPVLTLGGSRSGPEEAIEAARDAVGAGARGIVFGRNVWQADDPAKMSARLREAVHSASVAR